MILRGDFLYPRSDETCWKVTQQEIDLPGWIAGEMRERGRDLITVVHAGANVGVYAHAYAQMGATVYGFEPMSENFDCLVRNCTGPSFFFYRAVLGMVPRLVTVGGGGDNCGAHYVTSKIGKVPELALDLLMLSPDLIHLDVEGYEPYVLDGAADTITRCKPILALEWRSQWTKYGIATDEVLKQIEMLGYEMVDRHHNEALFAPVTS